MLDSIESAIEDIKNGKMIIVVDDENRENEGDFVMAAEFADEAAINAMASLGRGLICSPMTRDLAIKLKLPLMVRQNDAIHHTAFTVSIDHKNAGTGISCAARALTLRELTDDTAVADDFLRPGHIFPLIARDGGVLERPGHTEASIDFCRLAGVKPVGVICEIMNEDGSMARLPELRTLADKEGFKLVSIEDLRVYMEQKKQAVNKSQVYLEETVNLPTKFGDFKLSMFEDTVNDEHHLALHMGQWNDSTPVLVRVHSECLTGDVFGSMRCDCGEQLEQSMQEIATRGRGIIVYLRQEGRGIGLPNKIRAYALQEKGMNTFEANEALGLPADARTYRRAVDILKTLKVSKIELMTNNPDKVMALKNAKFEVVNRHALKSTANDFNLAYLQAKKNITKHDLNFLN